uniref:Uncharacterized protein n=1 Tax=Borely moumouvirus TaxID=2712067 RepID=A0A6G6AD40_9VIRU
MEISNDYSLDNDKMDICLSKNYSERVKEFIEYFLVANKLGVANTHKYYENSNIVILCKTNKSSISKYYFSFPENFEKIEIFGIKYINYYSNTYHENNISSDTRLITIFGTTIINNLVYNIVSNIIVSFEKYFPKIIDHCLFIM